jgi:hypothetical protein
VRHSIKSTGRFYDSRIDAEFKDDLTEFAVEHFKVEIHLVISPKSKSSTSRLSQLPPLSSVYLPFNEKIEPHEDAPTYPTSLRVFCIPPEDGVVRHDADRTYGERLKPGRFHEGSDITYYVPQNKYTADMLAVLRKDEAAITGKLADAGVTFNIVPPARWIEMSRMKLLTPAQEVCGSQAGDCDEG